MISAKQIRMARAALKWTMADLSKKTGLHRHTLSSVEQDDSPTRESTLILLKAIFENAGIKFEGDTCVCVEEE